jgi:hypothetical protein
MANADTEELFVGILAGIIKKLSLSVDEMAEAVGAPAFLDADKPTARFRYVNPDGRVYIVLMCVRIASALRAAMVLLVNNHTMEMGVLFRTIDDFCAEITFVSELLEKGDDDPNVTVEQKTFLERYFVDDSRTSEQMLADSTDPKKKINYNARRQKVQASEMRFANIENPHRVKQMVKTIDDTLSGVIHGEYASVMELYGGLPPRFHTEGMPVRFSAYRHYLGLQVSMALNSFCGAASKVGLPLLAERLRTLRQTFEKSSANTTR